MGVKTCTIEAKDLNFFLLDHNVGRPLCFTLMKRLEFLKMKVKHLKADWFLLLNRISMIPSQVLKKLSIETETFTPTQLKALVDVLESKKWKVSVEMKCKTFEVDTSLAETLT
jgi:hypothetical protein